MTYWLMKSEPDEASIDHLAQAPQQTLAWVGVRNYQARNFMRDTMKIGEAILFYHSSCAEPGIAGIARVSSAPYADPTQFDKGSAYYDAQSSLSQPRWFLVDVAFVKKTRLLSLAEMKSYPTLGSMRILARGNRLSITPVSQEEWAFILSVL